MYICTFQRHDVFLVCEVPLFYELLKTQLFWSLSKFFMEEPLAALGWTLVPNLFLASHMANTSKIIFAWCLGGVEDSKGRVQCKITTAMKLETICMSDDLYRDN